VFLTDVGDGALEFTALAYVGSARDAYRIKSELLFELVPDLRRAGIALASSSPVVHVGITDRAIEPGMPGV
jgi:small-conductance mechanosensitive channel